MVANYPLFDCYRYMWTEHKDELKFADRFHNVSKYSICQRFESCLILKYME